ncbi:hypothetical protein U8M34_29305, partial [Klebsiella pneumoniae]|uniref:hypothetical protein n=1 Tax=Klebsiella pneumoniae TaxID=573 RepID=UPI002ADF9CDB
ALLGPAKSDSPGFIDISLSLYFLKRWRVSLVICIFIPNKKPRTRRGFGLSIASPTIHVVAQRY